LNVHFVVLVGRRTCHVTTDYTFLPFTLQPQAQPRNIIRPGPHRAAGSDGRPGPRRPSARVRCG